jgi:RNA polymerase sigma-70 factor (ECF subfamily)
LKNTTQRFELHRDRLLGLAYRMLGSRADAEDVVQDAWFKWMHADRGDIESDAAYLTTIVTRLCLDRIKRERPRRVTYVGQWLPEPIEIAADSTMQGVDGLAEDLSFALLLALERLSPLERAAFLLHDVFEAPFAEVASVLERSETAVRQLAARARRSVREARPNPPASRETHRKLLQAFLTAIHEGDETQIRTLLREDAVMMSDTGGHKPTRPTAPRPIRGGHRIAHLLAVTRRKLREQAGAWTAAITSVNGYPGALIYNDDVLDLMLTITIDGERIAAVYALANPEKLARALPDRCS